MAEPDRHMSTTSATQEQLGERGNGGPLASPLPQQDHPFVRVERFGLHIEVVDPATNTPPAVIRAVPTHRLNAGLQRAFHEVLHQSSGNVEDPDPYGRCLRQSELGL